MRRCPWFCPYYHHPDRRQPQERQRVIREVLEILCQAPAAVEPRECPFDNPSARENLEALRLVGPLDDLDRKLRHRSRHGILEFGALITAVREQLGQKWEFPEQRG